MRRQTLFLSPIASKLPITIINAQWDFQRGANMINGTSLYPQKSYKL